MIKIIVFPKYNHHQAQKFFIVDYFVEIYQHLQIKNLPEILVDPLASELS